VRGRRRALAGAALVGLVMAGCGGASAAPAKSPHGHHAGASAPWPPNLTPGPPSQARFCAALVDQYRHLRQPPAATRTLAQREALVRDYVEFTPQVVAAAPATIAPAARVYLSSIAKVLNAFVAAGMDSRKVPPSVGSLLTNPQVEAAGSQVVAYASDDCHFSIETSA
jgi:hypothetical protein